MVVSIYITELLLCAINAHNHRPISMAILIYYTDNVSVCVCVLVCVTSEHLG